VEILAATGVASFANEAPLELILGETTAYPGYTVQPLSFQAWPGMRSSAALWLPEAASPPSGVLVLPGHFGEGKTAGECQEVAHALAARGIAALAVDMPGVEEWEQPGRQLHHQAGAHNRAVLVAAGTSALGLQLHLAQRGLAALREAAEVDRVAVTGASGGAVLAFYLALAEPGLAGLALASPVQLPHEQGTGGCYCDLLPGWPGPDPAVLAALPVPSLWLTELEQPALAGLPTSARWQVEKGPHSYTADMRAEALPWLDAHLGHTPPDKKRARAIRKSPPYTAGGALQSPTEQGALSIFELALQLGSPSTWAPDPLPEVSYTSLCEGQGPVVITAGASSADRQALLAAGLTACALDLPPDETWELRALTSDHALVDRPAGALRAAAQGPGVLGIYAVGAWAVAAAASGAPLVLRDPLSALEQVDPNADPAWVHIPGGWWGGLEQLYAPALATGSDPALLIAALTEQPSADAEGN